ncbi:MAG: phospholipase D-like domain-containing protein, partial [Nocardioidaceae bacterium]
LLRRTALVVLPVVGSLLAGVVAVGSLGSLANAAVTTSPAIPVIVVGPPLPTPTPVAPATSAAASPTPLPTATPTITIKPSATPTPTKPVATPTPTPTSQSAAVKPAIDTADTFVPTQGAVFGDPTATSNDILTELMDNIAHTPAGATIQIVGYSFSLDRVATALLTAYRRGVNVQVVMNGHSSQWSPAQRMVPVLGSDPTSQSFFVLTRGSARGTGGVTHQKSWTFSQVGRTPYVVMVGSMNLTGTGIDVQHSDAYTYTGHQDVYEVYARLFAVQKLDQPVTNAYREEPFDGGNASFYPRPGTTATDDPIIARLAALPSNSSTTIRIAQYAWWDTRGAWLAKALAAKAKAGARVQVVAGESVSNQVRSTLTAAGIPIHSGQYADSSRIHTKLMLAEYVVAGRTRQSVWTGSDNWTDQSFRNEETVLRIDDRVAYDAYVSFFDMLNTR